MDITVQELKEKLDRKDDFIFIEDETDIDVAVHKFEIICEAFGVPIKAQKNEGPGTCIDILGVKYDVVAMTAAMPKQRLGTIVLDCEAALEAGVAGSSSRANSAMGRLVNRSLYGSFVVY